jgi:hypothetical protein
MGDAAMKFLQRCGDERGSKGNASREQGAPELVWMRLGHA